MNIAVDVMGSDRGPAEMTLGAINAVRRLGINATLVGDRAVIDPVLANHTDVAGRITVVHAPMFVSMDDDSFSVKSEKEDCSMVTAMKIVADGNADGVVTAGSTGAAITAATLYIKRIRGIRRAALAPILPTADGRGCLLIDCGANAECTPEYLLQFAYMGSFYVKKVLGFDNPRVGLLNNGAEEHKGDALRKDTYPLLKTAHAEGRINFVGNIEGRDVPVGNVDVIVSDGFTGNVLLKTMEGTGMMFGGFIKDMFKSNIISMLSSLGVAGGIKRLKKIMDYREIGGSPLVGIAAPVIKAHGSADAFCMQNAIAQAKHYIAAEVVADITANIEHMKV